MAPEVITDGKLYDTKADLWSLGVTVYEIANGNPPFSNMEPLRAIAMIPRSASAKLEGDKWSSPMKEFMALCLTQDPSQRPSADELGRSKWIKGASRVPTTLLTELIVRYGGWVNAGGVRTSIIGDVARRDDTFTFDMDRPSSWLFDGRDNDFDALLVDTLGDEPYLAQTKRTNLNRINHSETSATTARSPLAQAANHPLMRLFSNDEAASSNSSYDSNGYGGTLQLSDAGSGAHDTLRPNSIAIPDFDEDDGVSAFAPTATPWYVASETSVSQIPLEEDVAEGDQDREWRAETESEDEDASKDNTGMISIPSELTSLTTVRPSWTNGNSPSLNTSSPLPLNFSMFNPIPFPRQRVRQASDDSAYGPFGGASFSSGSSGPLDRVPLSPSSSSGSDSVTRAVSPESFLTSRSDVATSPSLPTLPRSTEEITTEFESSSPSSASRVRSNTAPNLDSSLSPLPPTPSSGQAKNVLSFQKSNPFAVARAAMQWRPSALNIPEMHSMTLSALTPSILTPRHTSQVRSCVFASDCAF